MTKAARFIRNLRNRAFSLVELMIVVAIIGVLSTIAIQGVRRYLANAKSAEAKMQIGRIAKSAVISFDQDRFATTGVLRDSRKRARRAHKREGCQIPK